MIKQTWAALAAALYCSATTAQAASPNDVKTVAELLLRGDSEHAQWRNQPPITRKLHAWGVVVDSLIASAEVAGVPETAMMEAMPALTQALDPTRDVKAGDLFWVNYEQQFSVEGDPIGLGRVLWLELRTATKGTVSIHRFSVGNSGIEPFFLSTGQSTEAKPARLPLDQIAISSGFGPRVDPLTPNSRAGGAGPGRVKSLSQAMAANTPGTDNGSAAAATGAPPPGLAAKRDDRVKVNATGTFTNPASATFINPALSRAAAASPSPVGKPKGSSASASPANIGRARAPRRGLAMHHGVDLVAETGTPIHAAADGVIKGAAPNGNYGNWIEIAHEGKISTVYGHLSAFALGIAPGVRVLKNDLIGFVGNTGRSTGPHLHFELLVEGKPTNPLAHPLIMPTQLAGADLERFRQTMADNLAEAQRAGKPE